MMNFLLVDDHVVVRSGVKLVLQQALPQAEIFEAHDGNSALEKLAERKYDLMVLDIQMPKTDALILMQDISKKYRDLKVLVFSMSAENVYAKRFLKAGAKGYLSKDAPIEEITKAVTQVLDNRRYISDTLAAVLANESFEPNTDNPFNKLSSREFEIANLLLSGQTISSISAAINIKISTVGTHKSRMFEKLGVNNLLQLKELASTYNL